MYTLTINNKHFVLDADFKPAITYVNPCWRFNELPGVIVLDITIPENDTNKSLLGYPGRFSKRSKSNDRNFPGAELRHNGAFIIHGTLVITDTSKGYSGYIKNQVRTLSDSQREKLITDHILGGEITFENKTNYSPSTDLYCTIRLRNAGFFIDKGATEEYEKTVYNSDGTTSKKTDTREVITGKFEKTTGYMINETDADGVKTTANETEVIVVTPFPFLAKLIEVILRENKLFVKNSFLATDETLKTLCLYNNYSICISETTTEEVTYLDFGSKYHGIQTSKPANFTTETIELQTWGTGSFRIKDILPKMKLNELLLSVQNQTNTFFHFYGIDDVDNIDRETLFDRKPYDLSKYRVSSWRPGTRNNTILIFKSDNDSDDQEISENVNDISSREDDIKDSVAAFADLSAIASPTVGEIRLVTSEKTYYEYRQETVDDVDVLKWAVYSLDIQDYKYNKNGDNSEDIETKFSPIRMHEEGYPVVYQKGNCKQFSQYSENFSPRLMFYAGNNTGGSTASSGLELNWNSIVPKRYRRTAPFYANALSAEANFRLPSIVFSKVLREIYLPYDDTEGSFFIDEIQDAQESSSEYIDCTLSVFKNEDNIFESIKSQIIGGGGSHNTTTFTPKFIGVTDSGCPVLVTADGQYRTMTAFGQLSGAEFAAFTSIDYDADNKLLFVGGNNGQLHVCDMSDLENIHYKTIIIFDGTGDISAVSVINDGTTKRILIGSNSGCVAYSQPYHTSFNNYISNEATQTASFDHGTGAITGFMFFSGYFYSCSTEGEVHRTNNLATIWQQCADIDGSGSYPARFIKIAQTTSRIWVAEINDDSLYSLKTSPAQFNRFGGLAGSTRQKIRNMQSLLNNGILFICADDNASVWRVDPDNNMNLNITPTEIKNAEGACFDGSKYAYISILDNSGYTKIARYNSNPSIPEAVWDYISVPNLFSKLFMY